MFSKKIAVKKRKKLNSFFLLLDLIFIETNGSLVAQLVEHLTFNQVVRGSNPLRLISPHRLVGLGHRPFTAATGVRIPLGMLLLKIWILKNKTS